MAPSSQELKSLQNLARFSPLRGEGTVYYLSGNAPHQGGEDMACVLFDAAGTSCRSGCGNTASSGCMRRLATASRHLRIPANCAVSESVGGCCGGAGSAVANPPHRRTHASGVAAASTYIMTLSVFCDRGQPVLAMLLHRPPPSVPLTFTMVFHMGWVNVSMGRGHSAGTLWLADLSGSQLPRVLSSQADVACLRLDGDMQGEVSLKGAAAASQSALRSCNWRIT